MQADATAYIVAAAALAVAVWSYTHSDLQAKVDRCEAEYQGFKQGVIYER